MLVIGVHASNLLFAQPREHVKWSKKEGCSIVVPKTNTYVPFYVRATCSAYIPV